MKKLLKNPFGLTIIVIVVAVLALGLAELLSRPASLHDGNEVRVQVDQSQVEAKVATTDTSRAQGLSGSGPLGDTQGMLFVFPEASLHQFWMKGVTYPIDIIWIENDTVSEVTANVPPAPAGTPDDALPKYQPNFPAKQVLEVEAGWAARHNIQPGDPVRVTE